MRNDWHVRRDLLQKIEGVVQRLQEWNRQAEPDEEELERVRSCIGLFEHGGVSPRRFVIGGADSSGVFPLVSYHDQFVYLVTARTCLYEAHPEGILREVPFPEGELVEIFWIPEAAEERERQYDLIFECLAGVPLPEVVAASDYPELRQKVTGQLPNPDFILSHLIKPAAFDAGNIGTQLMTTAQLATIARALRRDLRVDYLLADTTLSLPLVGQRGCLFFELMKRYCCCLARRKGIGFFALAKSHGLPHIERIESLVRDEFGTDHHWYLRLPDLRTDGFELSFLKGRGLPPVGAVTYIVRFYTTTSPLRLDMDEFFWRERIYDPDPSRMREKERAIFTELDFACHDQRAYGYPYPLKAAHDRVSLSQQTREELRRRVIDRARKAGLSALDFIPADRRTKHA